jgi:hypothetical protein
MSSVGRSAAVSISEAIDLTTNMKWIDVWQKHSTEL